MKAQTTGPTELRDFRGLRERILEIESAGGTVQDIRGRNTLDDVFELRYRDAGGQNQTEKFTFGVITAGVLDYALKLVEGESGTRRLVAALNATPPPQHPTLELPDRPAYVEPARLTQVERDGLPIGRLGYALLRATHDNFDSVTVEGNFPGWWLFKEADAAAGLLLAARELGLSPARIADLIQHVHQEAVETNGKVQLTPASAAVFELAAKELDAAAPHLHLAELDWGGRAQEFKLQPLGLPADRAMAQALFDLQMFLRKELMGA